MSARFLLPWLFLPMTALDWWAAWGRLPERVVMNFGPNGAPASFATREQAMRFDLVLLACVSGVTTLVTLVVARLHPERTRHVAVGAVVCSAMLFLELNFVLWTRKMP